MTLTDLKDLVDNFNRETLGRLLGAEGVIDLDSMRPGEASITRPLYEANPNRCDCFCGRTSKGYTSAGDFVETCLKLSGPNGASGSVIAGAVIDNQSTDEDLPVVLAVGINYGQGYGYLNSPVHLVEATGIRPKLQKVGLALSGQSCSTQSLDGPFHLVVANFFPWITSQPWSAYKFNSNEESALIFCCGHEDPQEYILDLLKRIDPVAVVFHGANNAVPFLGTEVVRQSLTSGSRPRFEAAFCDNLAGRYQPGISNAIRLSCLGVNRTRMSATDYDA